MASRIIETVSLARRSFLKIIPVAGMLAACGTAKKIRLALNWKPDPEFGGFYAADYAKHGLDVELLPGGAGTPTVQMIGAGSAEFGIVSADEILLARDQGNDVVALFAAFQNNPQGIMVHASRKLESIGDVLKSGTLAIQSGLPYARLLRKQFGFDHVKVVPSPGGDLTAFLNDENFAQQCFVTAEPLLARRRGVDVKVFPVSDIGYNPYTTVLATSGDLLRRNPDMARNMVTAVREGWRSYLDNPAPTNQRMHALNPTMDAASFAEIAEAQKPLVEANVLGAMTKERWNTLAAQLRDLGDIKQAAPAEQYFRSL
ncbi:MAG: ABC transporter substrate-binding protein [Terriglobia bacterium]